MEGVDPAKEIDMPVSPLDIERRIKALRSHARQEVRGAPYAIYALLDPGDPNQFSGPGPFDGTPFYVGQSCKIEDRIAAHLRSSQHLTADSRLVHRHIAWLFAVGRLPRVAILDTAQTRSQSLMAELRWGQHMMRAGFELANNSPDFATLMSIPELESWLDHSRAKMLVSDAIREEVAIVHTCTCGHKDRWIDPAEHALFRTQRLRLTRIAAETQKCPGCGSDCEWRLDDWNLLNARRASFIDVGRREYSTETSSRNAVLAFRLAGTRCPGCAPCSN